MTRMQDPATIFKLITSRDMTAEDADYLRHLREIMPEGLAESPTYQFDLIMKYEEARRLRETIALASGVVTGDVQRLSQKAVAKIVDDAVIRIQASSPSSRRAFDSGLLAASAAVVLSAILATAAVVGTLRLGFWGPVSKSASDTTKIAFAEEVASRLNRAPVEWEIREGVVSPSLNLLWQNIEAGRLAVAKHAEASQSLSKRGGRASIVRLPGGSRNRNADFSRSTGGSHIDKREH